MFKNIFRNKKKQVNISLEEQLQKLGQQGIRLSSKAIFEDLLNEMDRGSIESNPLYFY
jgi:hypothetical protein